MQIGKQLGNVAVSDEPQDLLLLSGMDRFFERPFGFGDWIPWLPTRRWRRAWMPDEWMPDMDVFEREGKLVVRADLPV